jgi:hypothetical protein
MMMMMLMMIIIIQFNSLFINVLNSTANGQLLIIINNNKKKEKEEHEVPYRNRNSKNGHHQSGFYTRTKNHGLFTKDNCTWRNTDFKKSSDLKLDTLELGVISSHVNSTRTGT